MNKFMLRAKNIHKAYYNGSKEIQVLKGIDLDIEKGKFVAVIGPSGAGKSTLLHILGGLDSPSVGEVLIEGENLNTLKEEELCRIRNEKIGFVFQFYHLLTEFTVLENVFMPALIRSSARNLWPIIEEAKELLMQLGLSERLGHFPGELSGGEKQRVAIARALINKPAMLLCDEPTGNLDSKTGMDIMNLIKRLNSENEMAIVLVTHNLELAKLADNIYQLKDGLLGN